MTRSTNRKASGTARGKMIEAFWRCLGKTSYDKLTVAQIVREAGLNRNSFYYHFEDIDSMSRSVVAEVLDRDFLRKAFALLHDRSAPLDFSPGGDIDLRIERMCLIASDRSSVALQKMLRDAMTEIWCDTLGIDIEKLSNDDRLIFEFNLGGILSLLAYRANTSRDFALNDVMLSDFGKSIMASLESIAKSPVD
ncbi:TetR/AcrR family transcriptional regulator [Enteroscipio rubneri]|uniref:TetR/AcrR family transcriptional regulator n=1 Tax=Enteroscipio rubneri TaxID=2070686 RepID=UPI0032098E99